MSNKEPSLIQQRMALSRRRAFTALLIVLMALGLTVSIGSAVAYLDEARWGQWVAVALYSASLIWAIVACMRSIGRIRAFEARHGRDAGRQQPVSRGQ